MRKKLTLALLVLSLNGCALLDTTRTADAAAKSAKEDGLGPVKAVRSEAPLASFEPEPRAYANEDQDYATPPFSSLIPTSYDSNTPSILPGATKISTHELHRLLSSPEALNEQQPLVINALVGEASEAIEGSIWLSGCGEFGRMDDANQARLKTLLAELAGGDVKRMLVFYCLGVDCWHSYNAGLRAIALGYRNVHWYRGGLRAWYEAGLPTVPTTEDRWVQ